MSFISYLRRLFRRPEPVVQRTASAPVILERFAPRSFKPFNVHVQFYNHRKYRGMTFHVMPAADGKVLVGWAKCSAKDQYDKRIGAFTAMGRAFVAPPMNPRRVSKFIQETVYSNGGVWRVFDYLDKYML